MAYLEVCDYRMFGLKREIEKNLITLLGILDGVRADDIICPKECSQLLNWISFLEEYCGLAPFDELIPMVRNALKDRFLTNEECSDIRWVCNSFLAKNPKYDIITQSIQQLHGFINGLMADNIINEKEVISLNSWIQTNSLLTGTYPYDEIKSILTFILKDNIITDEEKDYLRAFISEFVDTSTSLYINQIELDSLRDKYSINGICMSNPDIVIKNRLFCFTGASYQYTRNQIAKIISEFGGNFNNNVILDTDYLIIGNKNNPCWAYSCYGRKVEKALEYRREGHKVALIHEDDFWNNLKQIG